MKWTLGLLLLAGAGCGYKETKMVACPEPGCTTTWQARSPNGLPGPQPGVQPPTAHEHTVEPGYVAPPPEQPPSPPEERTAPLPEPAPVP